MPIDITLIDDSILELTIQPFEMTQQFNESSFDFTWSPASLTDQILAIQCDFKDPLSISRNKIQDQMTIKFLQNKDSIFVPLETPSQTF